MVNREELSKETPLYVFAQYLDENYPDMFPLGDVSDFDRGKYAGKIEISRFLKDICEPVREEE